MSGCDPAAECAEPPAELDVTDAGAQQRLQGPRHHAHYPHSDVQFPPGAAPIRSLRLPTECRTGCQARRGAEHFSLLTLQPS